MPRRRRRQAEENIPFLTIILVAGVYLSYQEHQMQLIAILLCSLLVVAFILALKVYIQRQRINRLRASNIYEIDRMEPLEFEQYIKLLLEKRGYKQVRLTGYYDLGIDVIARKGEDAWGIQVKHYKGHVGLDSVRQAVAALNHYGCNRAMVITNSYFTKNARTIADSVNCLLLDRDALVTMILQT